MPETSNEARASISLEEITRTQERILWALRPDKYGPMTDEAMFTHIGEGYEVGGPSPSGLRTRRAELVALGLVEDSGERVRGKTGRRMVVWRLAVISPLRSGPPPVVESGMRPNRMPGRPDRYVDLSKAKGQAADQSRKSREAADRKALRETPWLEKPPRVTFGQDLCTTCQATGGNKLDGPCWACGGNGVR